MKRRRLFWDWLFKLASGGATFFTLFLLGGILFLVATKGLPHFNGSFLVTPMRAAATAGGVLYQLLGTLILVATATVLVSPLAYSFSLIHVFYLGDGRLRRFLSKFLYTLNGLPSILFGLFGFFLFVKYFGWGKSWLAGGILLAMVVFPTVTIAIEERIKSIQPGQIDGALALGFTRNQASWAVLIPQSLSGYLTGLLLGIIRAAGETAPLLFTAAVFAGATLPTGIVDNPVLCLPYHILVLAQDTYNPQALAHGWGAAFTLILVVFTLSLLALPLRYKIHEVAHRE